MAYIYNVVKSPIKGKTGTLSRSSGYEYRDFWYTNASGQRVHVVGWHRALDITTLGTIVAFARGKVVSIQKESRDKRLILAVVIVLHYCTLTVARHYIVI